METIGIIYEITGNPYFNEQAQRPDQLAEYVYPSEISDICRAFTESGYQFEVIDGARDLLNRWEEIRNKCSVLFNKSIGFTGLERKIAVPALAQIYQLPILGSSAYSMTLARHKYHTSQLLKGMGFLTPDAEILLSKDSAITISQFPVIIKPNAESDSLGIYKDSVCYTKEEARNKSIQIAADFGYPIVIEQFIPGEELKVPVIGNYQNIFAAGCIRLLKDGKSIAGSFQTRDDIIGNSISYAVFNEEQLVSEVKFLAEKIHILMELRDYSRIDFRLGENNKIYCMEVSTHPDISKEGSSFIKAALQSYPNYYAVINAIIDACKKRLEL